MTIEIQAVDSMSAELEYTPHPKPQAFWLAFYRIEGDHSWWKVYEPSYPDKQFPVYGFLSENEAIEAAKKACEFSRAKCYIKIIRFDL